MNCNRHIFADVAQSVAHLIGSEEVTGSIPVISFWKPLIFQGFFYISEGCADPLWSAAYFLFF